MSIYDLLAHIHRRPGMYIVEPSIYRLQAFLTGYDAALGYVGLILQDEIGFHRFHDWVARRLGFFESTSGWADMIRAKSADDKEAFAQFFVLLEEFRNEGK